MKIAVIGTIVRDVLEHYDGSVSHSLGGLLYTINALRAMLDEPFTICPICFVGQDIYPNVERMYGSDRVIDPSGFIPIAQENNWVRIVYHTPEERSEYSMAPLPPLEYEQVQGALQCDAIIVNLISGWDIRLDAMQEIRKRFDGLIALDVHSLTLGRKSDGRRYLRYPPDIIEWITCTDIIDMNESEFNLMVSKYDDLDFFWKESCFRTTKILNLTFGSRGSHSYLINRHGIQRFIETKPGKGVEVTDPTGCGDAFLGGFVVEYLRSEDINNAAQMANRIAAASGAFKGLPEPNALRKKLEEING